MSMHKGMYHCETITDHHGPYQHQLNTDLRLCWIDDSADKDDDAIKYTLGKGSDDTRYKQYRHSTIHNSNKMSMRHD